MLLADVLAELESLGTEQARKIYRRHGGQDPLFGVSFANLGKMKKRIKRDQPLAEALWATRNGDAQQLAVMIADPAAFDAAKLQHWVDTANCYANVDPLAKDVVIRTPYAVELAARWIAATSPIDQRAGWATIGNLALSDGSLPDEYFLDWLPVIETSIHTAENRTTEAMNSALIAIGGRNQALRGPAIDTARRIGPVTIDHGETDCQTFEAIPYIEKMHARKAARATA
jgi:3-methyladenine DNA glycosylase AlkD